jgi:Flp pilus assembly protein TadG
VRHLATGESGTAAIEFALAAPLFLMLLFGTVEFGRLLWTKQALQETAAAAARCMAILENGCTSGGRYYSATNTTAYVQQIAAQWGVTLTTGDITLTPNAACGITSEALFSQVSIASTFKSAAAALLDMPNGGFSLSANACYPNNS